MNEHEFLKAVAAAHLDGRALKHKILYQNKKRNKKSWLIPVMACLAAVAVVCTAVPPVRAAILQWFKAHFSVENYVAQPQESKGSAPELDAIIQKSTPAEAENSIVLSDVKSGWESWADMLDPKINDIYFDGRKLILGIDMGGGVPELISQNNFSSSDGFEKIRLGDPMYLEMNGTKYDMRNGNGLSGFIDLAKSEYDKYDAYRDENYEMTEEGIAAMQEADSCLFAFTINGFEPRTQPKDGDFVLPELTEEEKAELAEMRREDEKWWKQRQAQYQAFDPEYIPAELKEFDAAQKLQGVQQATVVIPIETWNEVTHEEEDGTLTGHRESEPIAKLTLTFSFDPAAQELANQKEYELSESRMFTGEETFRWADWNSEEDYATFKNITKDLSGAQMTVKRMEVYPDQTLLYVSVNGSAQWSEQEREMFCSSLTPQVLGDGQPLMQTGEQYGLEEQGEDMGLCIELQMLPSEVETIHTFGLLWTLSRYSGYDDVPYVEGKPTRIKKDEIDGWQEESTQLEQCVLEFSLKDAPK